MNDYFRIGVAALLGLTFAQGASAQLSQSIFRASNGQIYQVIAHAQAADVGIGVDDVRVTTIAASASGATSTCAIPGNLFLNEPAEAWASAALGQIFDLSQISSSPIIGDASAPVFSPTGDGTVCIGPACLPDATCPDTNLCSSFSGFGTPITDGTIIPVAELQPVLPSTPNCTFGPQASYSFGTAGGNPSRVADICEDLSNIPDGFTLRGSGAQFTGGINGETIIFVHPNSPADSFSVAAAGFGVDLDTGSFVCPGTPNPNGLIMNGFADQDSAPAPANTATPTGTPTSTETPTGTPTETMTSAPTETPTNTETPTPTSPPTNTETPTPTSPPTNTETPTPTSPPTNTETPTPTSPPTNTETPTGTPTETPTPTPTPEVVSTEAPAGGTVSTDSENDGATALDPVETSVTSPNPGQVSISESETVNPAPIGFTLLGQEVDIQAPPADGQDPLVIAFEIDASLVPPGADENTIEVFKDGVLVDDCQGSSGQANPDPCVSSRTTLPTGNIELVVLTSTASDWNFGVPDEPHGDDECAGLRGAAFGLCNAFCKALDCDTDPPSEKACERLSIRYEKLTGDSLFPCED